MNKHTVGTTKNGKLVYVDLVGSHAATHIRDTPGLFDVAKQIVMQLEPVDDNICIDIDMGCIIGTSDLVRTDHTDEIVYAKRLNRDNYTRFVRNREPQPTRFVTIVLQQDTDGHYELWSIWCGPKTPQFPGDEHEAPESRPFWRKHALVWGNQEIQPGTEQSDWPWN